MFRRESIGNYDTTRILSLCFRIVSDSKDLFLFEKAMRISTVVVACMDFVVLTRVVYATVGIHTEEGLHSHHRKQTSNRVRKLVSW